MTCRCDAAELRAALHQSPKDTQHAQNQRLLGARLGVLGLIASKLGAMRPLLERMQRLLDLLPLLVSKR